MPASDPSPTPPAGIVRGADPGTVRLEGSWITAELAQLEPAIAGLAWPEAATVTLDAGGICALDTGGAWRLLELARQAGDGGRQVRWNGLREEHRGLLDLVGERQADMGRVPPPAQPALLEAIGRNAWGHLEQGMSLLAFVGEVWIGLWRSLLSPSRIRWSALLAAMERAGVHALPIVGLLSFLIGVVLAYQGGIQLRAYGANIFVVELVGLTVLRELAPMMAAIIVAGRTGSAYTAEIGTMKVTEEIDALRTMGIAPMDLLVLPKLLGLMLALPLLTVFADGLGLLGGMVMARVALGVSLADFADRLPQAVSLTSFLIGVVKAPVFAAIVATVGCFQGFRVGGGADSVGRQTTISVVQAIFLVIIADAAFSVMFSWLGI